MPEEKDTAPYTCPDCHRQTTVKVRNGKWTYSKHNNARGSTCRMSGAEL